MTGAQSKWIKRGTWCMSILRSDLMRIPAIVIAQSGHRDRRFWAS